LLELGVAEHVLRIYGFEGSEDGVRGLQLGEVVWLGLGRAGVYFEEIPEMVQVVH